MKIESNEIIIAILQNPREKIIGVLEEISPSGLFIRGFDLSYFEDLTAAIKNGEPYLPMQDYFFPMWRVERITRDESSFDVLSLAKQFEQKTGLNFLDF